jgi:ABC-type multidrug transport system fused ATPase/permease subunit
MFILESSAILDSPILYKLKQNVESIVAESAGVENKQTAIHTNFKLPIEYLPEDQIFPLNPVVSADLELVESKSEKSMYEHLFQPSSPFAKEMVHKWKNQYTTNTDYLGQTQQILLEQKNVDIILSKSDTNTPYKLKHDILMSIWDDVKKDEDFLEKYCFVEWDVLKPLNRSSGFLQVLSIANIMSPAISLVIPILFLLFPFIILKIRGIPITFSVYIDVLKEIAKNHFIGKTLVGLSSISWEKAAYMVITLGLYLYQIYQNVLMCTRFYRNIQKINTSLYEYKCYLDYSIRNMDTFVEFHGAKPCYTAFCKDVQEHCNVLRAFRQELDAITETQPHIVGKLASVGYLLKCYYELHANKAYESSLKYSFGFEGFLDNIRGVSAHLTSGKIVLAQFDVSGGSCKFKDQYYPPLMNEDPVKNSCDLSKSMVITGPNASGKTTMLKTTTLNVIFTQQMGCGFYSACILQPYTHIHSYLNIPDTSERDSLFQAESRRCKEIIDVILDNSVAKGSRHYCIFDELYSGTNPAEATKSAYAFLSYLTKFSNVDFILTTHYVSVCKKLKKSKRVQNYKMMVESNKNGTMVYTYKIKKGISKVQGAVRILEDMQYPDEIIQQVKNC